MAHIHEKIDFVVNAFIVNQQRVLLIFHKKMKMWLPIGGHIELDENPEEALFREVKEECGLEIELANKKPDLKFDGVKILPMPNFIDIHPVIDNHHHIALEYFAKSKSDAVVHNKDEHDDIKWFSAEELDDSKYNIHPAVIFYGKEALKINN